MLKRLGLALAGIFAFAQLALASGTIPYSLSQQLDSLGKPLSGGRLYLIQAGTTSTPQNCYQDSALTIVMPNPITLDAAGRIGQFFCADGSIKVRLTDKNGVTQVVADGIQVIGPSGGGGGGSTVDATTVLATGDLKVKYGTGTISGFVRANGRTIGSATSGATERANADVQALFEYLCSTDLNLVMSGGRGVTCNADWVANKTLALPDWRGRALAGLDDMGNTSAARMSPALGVLSTTLGGAGGLPNATLSIGNLPPYTPSGSVSTTTTTTATSNPMAPSGTSGGTLPAAGNSTPAVTDSSLVLSSTSTSTFTGAAQGGSSAPFNTLSPVMLATIYVKL